MAVVTKADVRIGVLGPVEADRNGDQVGLGGHKQQCVLALLVAAAPRVVSADALAFGVYGDDTPDRGRRRVQTYVSTLRGILGDVIVRSGEGWYLDVERVEIDVKEFEQRSEIPDNTRAAEAASMLRDALDLWRGTPYGSLETHGELDSEISRLEELRLRTLERRLDADLASGRAEELISELSVLVGEHPYREGLRARHMLALYRAGRQKEALQSFTDQRTLLIEELGVDPSPELVELEAQILRHDEALEHVPEPEGEPLRGYRLLETIGADESVTKWRAVQPSTAREVAVRRIDPAVSSSPAFIRGFETKAQAIARLEHPNVLQLVDFWRDPDGAFLVTRWLGGGLLDEAVASGSINAAHGIRIVEQVGAALASAHRMGIAHGTIDPSHVYLDTEGNAFLAVFNNDPTLVSVGTAGVGPKERNEDLVALGVLARRCLSSDAASTDLAIARMRASDVSDAVITAIVDAANPNNTRFTTVEHFLAALAGPETAADEVIDLRNFTNPFKGLRAFEEVDSGEFFGRTALIDEMCRQLSGTDSTSQMMTVVGPSGSGKSSLVQAGLLPALRNGQVDGSASWFIASMVPGSAPFAALVEALASVSVAPIDPSTPVDELQSVFASVAGERTVLLVVDQLEELFTTAPPTDAERFLSLLTHAVADPAISLRVVATLRADHYGEPLQHPEFAELFKAGALDVTPLTSEELVAVISQPARGRGLRFDDGLVARIIADVDRQSSPLPLLQYTLAELVERRAGPGLTNDAYDKIGGIAGAIGARAETMYLESTAAEQEAVRRLFARLVNPDRAAVDLRRRALLADLHEDEMIRAALGRYGAARLLSFDRDPVSREPTVEVAHEALLREWPRLANWLHEDQAIIKSIDRLGLAVDAWHEGGRADADLYRGVRLESALQLQEEAGGRLRSIDRGFIDASHTLSENERTIEQQRVRRLRRLIVGIGAALVVAIVAGALAFVQQRRASEREVAASARGLAASSTAIADRELDTALLLAANASALDPSLATNAGLVTALEQAVQLEAFDTMPDAEHVGAVRTSAGVTVVLYPELGELRSFVAGTTEPVGPRIELGEVQDPYQIALSADGASVGVIDLESARSWDVSTGQTLVDDVPTPAGTVAPHISFSPQSSYMVVMSMPGLENQVIRTSDGVVLGSIDVALQPQFSQPTFSPDESRVYWVGEADFEAGTSLLNMFSVPDLEQIGEPVEYDVFATTVEPSPDGSLLALGVDYPEAEVLLVDAETLTPVGVPVTLKADRLFTILWSPDSQWASVHTVSGEVAVLSAETGAIESRLVGNAAQPQGAGWIDESRYVVHSNGEQVVWDIARYSAFAEPFSDEGAVFAAVDQDGRMLVSGEQLLVVDADGTERSVEKGQCGPVFPQSFGDLALLLCVGPQVTVVKIINIVTGEVLLPETDITDEASADLDFALSPDGSQFALVGASSDLGGSNGGTLAVHSARDGALHDERVQLDVWVLAAVEWTRDGEYVLAGGQAGELLWVDPDSLEVVDRVTTSAAAITDISWDSAGEHVVVANEFGEVWLIDVAARKAVGEPFTGAAGQFQTADISVDGKRIAALGRDQRVRVWDRETGAIIGTPMAGPPLDEQPSINGVRFLADGRIVTWTEGTVVHVWDLEPEALRARACELAGRGLNDRERTAFGQDLGSSDVCAP